MGWLQEMLKEVPLSSVLKERVALAEQKYERASQEIESQKRRIAELERENRELRSSTPSKSGQTVSEETARVLVYLFRETELDGRAVGIMAQRLNMERGVLLYHLDRLEAAKFANAGSFYDGEAYWGLTAEGRRHVVESSLH